MPTCVAPRHVDASRDFFFSPNEQRGGRGGDALPDFSFFLFFPVQQNTSGIGHRLKKSSVFRVGNQYAECEKQHNFPIHLYIYLELVDFLHEH